RAEYGNKFVSIFCHLTWGTCKWWRLNKNSEHVRSHGCIMNNTGIARLMEIELHSRVTPAESSEECGDTSKISILKSSPNLEMEKKFDETHVLKSIKKHFRTLQNENLSYKGPLVCNKLPERLSMFNVPINIKSHLYSD
ncbi:hypothetical protein MAR_034951, partial [Mya arenaria]